MIRFLITLLILTVSNVTANDKQNEPTSQNNSSLAKLDEPINLNELPTIGNSSSALVSLQQERELGAAWLRKLRQNTKSYYNPLLNEYLENLIYKLAPNSEVADKNFTLTIIDSPTLNAFAVPGSIIGINAGLLTYTRTEHELASVLAHELAHLSQRHFARRVEQQQQTAPLRLLGMLASAIILASAQSEAGLATLASTQALSIDKELRFSRQNEQEADRIGLLTLQRSNFNPYAMSNMFERMYAQSKASGNSLPEYLSTHPLSQTRISDTKSRASQFKPKHYSNNINFHFVRAMILSDYAESKQRAADNFRQHTSTNNTQLRHSSVFGLAYSLIPIKPKESAILFKALLKKYPHNIFLVVNLANALREAGELTESIETLENELKQTPQNYSLTLTLSLHYLEADRIPKSVELLSKLSKRRSEDPYIWFQLAEALGLAGDIVKLHQARAEYFYLTNRIEQAIKQIKLAITKNSNDLEQIKMQERLDLFYETKQNPKI